MQMRNRSEQFLVWVNTRVKKTQSRFSVKKRTEIWEVNQNNEKTLFLKRTVVQRTNLVCEKLFTRIENLFNESFSPDYAVLKRGTSSGRQTTTSTRRRTTSSLRTAVREPSRESLRRARRATVLSTWYQRSDTSPEALAEDFHSRLRRFQ